jgi:hypothetical protein
MQEDTLSELAKKTGVFTLGALIGKGGSKFGGLDIKRVYFGSAYLSPCLQESSHLFLGTGSETIVKFVAYSRPTGTLLTDAHNERLWI